MKKFAKKNTTQKILLMIVMVVLFNFAMPKPVQADTVGTIISPFFGLVGVIADGIQHLIEWAILGETESFMKSIEEGTAQSPMVLGLPTVEPIDSSKLDGSFWGIDAVNIPVIKYSPEAIFAGKVPALEINFISPDYTSDEGSIAADLQNTIASWYKALRNIAIVGLLTVIVYLGIRMLITSIAADKAKYKKMIMDWVIAMCLLFVMHYIMSFTLTATQALIGVLGGDAPGTINVRVTGSKMYSFSTNLIGYTRFMMQHVDLQEKVAFTTLYIMLLIFSVRFTWTYLKRVVNMAFLTVIAPFVTLTYPIDKISDGKAQAFNIWLKEYIFNCLLQPMHLLLYRLLLGSALELATKNILYAVVCFGFIISAEKLVRKMFGFDKASGGTLGTLAGAAGVSSFASKAVTSIGGKASNGKGSQSKVRTQDKNPQRTGRDNDANHGFQAFEEGGEPLSGGVPGGTEESGGVGEESPVSSEDGSNTPTSTEQADTMNQQEGGGQPGGSGQQGQQTGANTSGMGQEANGSTGDQTAREPNTQGSPNPDMTRNRLENIRTVEDSPTFTELMGRGIRKAGHGIASTTGKIKDATLAAPGKIGRGIKAAPRRVITGVKAAPGRAKQGIVSGASNLNKKAGKAMVEAGKAIKDIAPTVVYKAARGTLKGAATAVGALTLGTAGLASAATTGDLDQGFKMAVDGIRAGASAGGGLFEGTVGRNVMPERSIVQAAQTHKYGSRRAAENAKADKNFLRSQEFEEYYNDQIKSSKELKNISKKDIKQAFLDYRQAGITDNTQIKNALKLEQAKDENGNAIFSRGEVQNIVQSSKLIDDRAYVNDAAREKTINRLSGMLNKEKFTEEQRKAMANRIFKGNEMYRNI